MAVFTAAATLRINTEIGTVDQDLVDENGIAIVDENSQQITAGGQKAVVARVRAVGRASSSISSAIATDGLPLGMQVATSLLSVATSLTALPVVVRRFEAAAVLAASSGLSIHPLTRAVAEAGLSIDSAIATDGLPKGMQVATSLVAAHVAVLATPSVARRIEAEALVAINSNVFSFAVGGTRYHAIKLIGISTPAITLAGETLDTEDMIGTAGRPRVLSPTSVKLTGTRS